MKRPFPRLLTIAALAPAIFAQSSEVSITSPPPPKYIGPILKPFHLEKRIVSPARLTNSPRLESLVRGGNLYLSVQDVIALALENNLDIAVQRYGPFLAREVVRRTESGNLLRQVDTPITPGPTSVSTAGISTNGNGLGGGGALGSGTTLVSAFGPGIPNLDPTIVLQASFGHFTTPQTNTVLNATTALTSANRSLFAQYSQQFITGTSYAISFFDQRTALNSPSTLFNPYLNGSFDIQVSQNLMQGRATSVNNRFIRVARNNTKVSTLQLKLQVITTVSAVLNLYWDLVSFNDAVRIKEQALETAQRLHEGNKKQVAIGALPAIEVTRAAAEVSSTKEDLLFAQTNVAQQEIVLKNALNRNAMQNTWLDDVHIVPLDHIEIPKTDEIRPIADLIQEALENRGEVEIGKVNIDSQKIVVTADKNGLMPSIQAYAEVQNHGLAGPANPLCNGCGLPNEYFIGGNGTVFSQLLRRNFPDYSAGFSLNLPFRNRAAQADYVTDQLQLRQKELQYQRAVNQVRVDVKTAVIGLQQARSRFQTAVDGRVLSEQSLKAEQSRFTYGVATVAQLIQAQRDLAVAEDAEIQAMANYTHAKIAYDNALGRTLDVNHIGMDEATSGTVKRESVLPDVLPKLGQGVAK